MSRSAPNCLKPPAENQDVRPVLDGYDLAVRLEMEGVTDAVARDQFGFSSTLAMARGQVGGLMELDFPVSRAAEKSRWKQFFNGIAFAIPVLICTMTSLLFRLSLWGGDLSADVATAVAIGTVSSFLATGGLIQASARRTLFQIHCDNWDEACATCYDWSLLGIKVVAGTALLGWFLNHYFGWLPVSIALVALSFHFVLGLLWISCGILYVLERSWAIGAAVLGGIGTVAVTHLILGWPLLGSQLGGVAVTAVAGFVVASRMMRRRSKKWGRGEDFSIRVAHKVAPYFAYGCCYYLFLFADRLLAWTAQTNSSALPLQFRGDYETALDIAMIAFILQAGWVHMSISEFYGHLRKAQVDFSVRQAAAFNGALRRFYFRRAAWFLPAAAAVSLATYFVARYCGLLPTTEMQKVTGVALAAYPLLVFGLWNTGLVFSLSRPAGAFVGIVAALSVNLIVGYTLSRVGTYESAVYGFAAGSAVFALLTTVRFLRIGRAADYNHFSAAA